MTPTPDLQVVVVDDDEGVRYTLDAALRDHGLGVRAFADGPSALASVRASRPAALITDLRMPGMDGMQLLRELQRLDDPPPVLMITAHGCERDAVQAIKAGAYDYFRKPFEIDEVLAAVDRTLDNVRLRYENQRLSGELALSKSMVFASRALHDLARVIHRVGPRDVTVLIHGESGTGKERIAETLVRASTRADKPYVRFNCAAIGAELAEAELFGHTRGAFTGATKARAGLFREAHTGTLLLDEIAELDLSVQAKLLRVLQDGEIRALGRDSTEKVDVRILAATHRDLARCVEQGSFREDLYYRLQVVRLEVPSLRERPEDIDELSQHFLQRYCDRFGVASIDWSAQLRDRLHAYDWPGNVRELENALEALVAMSDRGQIDIESLPRTRSAPARPQVDESAEPDEAVNITATLEERMNAYERGQLLAALRASGGKKTLAAKSLGIGRTTLHEKLKKHAIG